ncbi:MAG: DUF362 domain-containing protein [Puniceicoccaceae bacterium]|nr:MAG: DUF362 domain-containing protein [Puniceicoccaceae bacterium]
MTGFAAVPAAGNAASAEASTPPAPSNRVWEADLGDLGADAYRRAVAALLASFEERQERRLVPGEKGRVGLKVYADSGPGLATPAALIHAVVAALQERGFRRENIFLIGLHSGRLRASGFLPPLSEGGSDFQGLRVKALDSGHFYDADWYYDSPLPSRIDALGMTVGDRDSGTQLAADSDERKSFLPLPLLLDVDFWINLPVYTDHPVLGINGALVNATLWNASNTLRFFRSPATAPAAVAEMAAIPELRGGWVVNLVSLERYQFIGGPYFNSLYTRGEPKLWLSDNPVLLDALMQERINAGRTAAGFRPLREDLRLLDYARQLGLGNASVERIEWIRPLN